MEGTPVALTADGNRHDYLRRGAGGWPMFARENGAAIAWLLLFVFMVSAAAYDRAFKPAAEIVALK